MTTTDFIAAIELGSSKATGIAGQKNADGSIRVLACVHEDAAPFVHKGCVYNIDKAAQALTAIVGRLEEKLQSSIAKVYVGIGGQSLRTVKNIVSRDMEQEGVISTELVDAICDENREAPLVDMCVLDVAPQEYKIDNALYADPIGVTGRRITGQFFNIVARASLKKNLERCFEQAGIKIADLFVAPLMLAKAVLSESEMRSGCALVDFGADTTTVQVYKNNILRHLSVLPLGGNNITRDIATLQMEEEDAEKLKLQYSNALYEEEEDTELPATCTLEDGRSFELAALNNIVGARAEEILANVWNQIQLSGYEGKLFSGIVFTGGAANLKNLDTLFRKVSRQDKVKTVEFIRAAVAGCEDQLEKNGRLNTALGLLAAGNENCCKPKPEPQTNKVPEQLNVFDSNEEERKKLEEVERIAKKQKEEEERKREEERNNKHGNKNNGGKPGTKIGTKKGGFGQRILDVFGVGSNSLFDPESDSKLE